jgi:hypothetical protein
LARPLVVIAAIGAAVVLSRHTSVSKPSYLFIDHLTTRLQRPCPRYPSANTR